MALSYSILFERYKKVKKERDNILNENLSINRVVKKQETEISKLKNEITELLLLLYAEVDEINKKV